MQDRRSGKRLAAEISFERGIQVELSKPNGFVAQRDRADVQPAVEVERGEVLPVELLELNIRDAADRVLVGNNRQIDRVCFDVDLRPVCCICGSDAPGLAWPRLRERRRCESQRHHS